MTWDTFLNFDFWNYWLNIANLIILSVAEFYYFLAKNPDALACYIVFKKENLKSKDRLQAEITRLKNLIANLNSFQKYLRKLNLNIVKNDIVYNMINDEKRKLVVFEKLIYSRLQNESWLSHDELKNFLSRSFELINQSIFIILSYFLMNFEKKILIMDEMDDIILVEQKDYNSYLTWIIQALIFSRKFILIINTKKFNKYLKRMVKYNIAHDNVSFTLDNLLN